MNLQGQWHRSASLTDLNVPASSVGEVRRQLRRVIYGFALTCHLTFTGGKHGRSKANQSVRPGRVWTSDTPSRGLARSGVPIR